MNVEKLYENLEQANTLEKLSNSFDEITKALNKSCDNVFKSLFDYNFSTFLYYNYIILNKTKREIADELKMHPSTVYYYIKKYNLKKPKHLINKKMMTSLKETCNRKYNVNHPGELPEAHRKRIDNILNKTKGNYSKSFYVKLNRSDDTLNKMRQSQQIRRIIEKEGEI